jgi:uncharacterized integral membrane protein
VGNRYIYYSLFQMAGPNLTPVPPEAIYWISKSCLRTTVWNCSAGLRIAIMRQINFVVIFVICLALVLFGIENAAPATIHVIEGRDLSAPLSIELILAMGLGAVLAWVFSVWNRLQYGVQAGQQLQERDERIQELEEDVQRYKVELEEQQRLLPASPTAQSDDDEIEVTEVYS